jgi:hypothetical protein
MTKRRLLVSAGIMLFATIAIALSAAAQPSPPATTGGNHIEITPVIVALINLVFPAVIGVATYIINANVKNQQMATLLTNAVQNGLGVVQQQADSAAQKAHVAFDVQSPAIQAGVRYVVENAAEAIAHFNIPEAQIAGKLSAKLGLAAIATNLAMTASPQPVIAGPMAAVSVAAVKTG